MFKYTLLGIQSWRRAVGGGGGIGGRGGVDEEEEF